MKHARPDYDRIQDPEGKIPDDEPVFLLRAQDISAATVVRVWAHHAEANGASPEMVRIAREHAEKMADWPNRKVPDLPPSG